MILQIYFKSKCLWNRKETRICIKILSLSKDIILFLFSFLQISVYPARSKFWFYNQVTNGFFKLKIAFILRASAKFG